MTASAFMPRLSRIPHSRDIRRKKHCARALKIKLHPETEWALVFIPRHVWSRTPERGFWQGVLVYFEINSDQEIIPNSVVDNRTDVKSQYNETFLERQDAFDELW